MFLMLVGALAAQIDIDELLCGRRAPFLMRCSFRQ